MVKDKLINVQGYKDKLPTLENCSSYFLTITK